MAHELEADGGVFERAGVSPTHGCGGWILITRYSNLDLKKQIFLKKELVYLTVQAAIRLARY